MAVLSTMTVNLMNRPDGRAELKEKMARDGFSD